MEGLRVLVVEDDPLLRQLLFDWLVGDGYGVVVASTGGDALVEARKGVDAVVLDYRLPDVDGFEVLRQLQREHPALAVVMLTGHASVAHSVEAMKRGAFHYLSKPADLSEVSCLVQQAARASVARRGSAGAVSLGDDPTCQLLGETPAIREARALIRRLSARSTATVLITGESGTGKDLAARALHAASPRAHKPFTNITCTALPTNLLESELFGHERGAFTDAKARHIGLLERSEGGTVFLDEIGDMEPALQAKLLHVLEHKQFRRVGGSEDLVADVRIIAATNVDLGAAVQQRRFRPDLYYRLAVLTLHMPPLRERRADIELLARHFAERFCAETGDPACEISDAAMHVLATHDWPGNVRELKNVLERAVILADGATLRPENISLAGPRSTGGDQFVLPPDGVDVRALERKFLVEALERTDGNVTRAAKLLGMNRDQVRYRVQKLGLRDVEAGGSADLD